MQRLLRDHTGGANKSEGKDSQKSEAKEKTQRRVGNNEKDKPPGRTFEVCLRYESKVFMENTKVA